jgi:2-polyprenyl-3-methyl-5-hydroxy-6-metoxy-1,4-benzoquinol methylase
MHNAKHHSTASRSSKAPWDHSSHDRFYEYYAEVSQSEATFQRFAAIRAMILRVMGEQSTTHPLEVADIGCGAGTQCLVWAELGHMVHGLDVNEPLLALAKERAINAGVGIDFRVGSATELPWANESMDVCLVPELLEHVVAWKTCLDECMRILRPGGILFISTTNKLCPRQQEFDLPFYSWYPAPLKRYCEHLAVTTRPDLVNFARYPAVHWFSFYRLRAVLATGGFQCMDRFDVMDLTQKSTLARMLVSSLRALSLLRWCAHVATPSTIVVASKRHS